MCVCVDYFYELHLSSSEDIHKASDLSKQQTGKLLIKAFEPSFRAISNSSYHYLHFQKKNMMFCMLYHSELILSEKKMGPNVIVALTAHHTPKLMPCSSSNGIFCRTYHLREYLSSFVCKISQHWIKFNVTHPFIKPAF